MGDDKKQDYLDTAQNFLDNLTPANPGYSRAQQG